MWLLRYRRVDLEIPGYGTVVGRRGRRGGLRSGMVVMVVQLRLWCFGGRRNWSVLGWIMVIAGGQVSRLGSKGLCLGEATACFELPSCPSLALLRSRDGNSCQRKEGAHEVGSAAGACHGTGTLP